MILYLKKERYTMIVKSERIVNIVVANASPARLQKNISLLFQESFQIIYMALTNC